MALIHVKNLYFEYPGSYEPIFVDLNLQLDTNWKLGFIGRNGYGKTTFMKLLMDEYEYTGSILKPLEMKYFPYAIDDTENTTLQILENFEENLEIWLLQKEMNLLEIQEEILYRPFSTLSGGEQTKIQLALLFSVEERFLLIDEPTNHLDVKGRQVVAKYLNSKKGFILVSHDRDFLNEIIDHTLTIEKNKIVLQRGDFDTWEENKRLEDQYEVDKNEKLKKEINRLSKSAQEKAAWSDKVEASKIGSGVFDRGYVGHKAAKMMKRSKAIEKRFEDAIEDRKSLLKNIEETDQLKINQLNYHSKQLMVVEDLSISYKGKRVFDPVSFVLEAGDCMVLKGRNGSGKTSLIKALLGADVNWEGRLSIGKGIRISYIPQKVDFLFGSINDFVSNEGLDKTMFLTILRKLGFSRSQFDLPMENFSMGQKKKVLIAKSICEHAHIFIWDEPLNYIDVISRIQLEDMILRYKPTMIIVEHDNRFINRVGTKEIELERRV